uniref:Uncharacterized protein n=1 Tax=Candida parapsilosis (strain CDC 317 / ATCC MYA-4646) TaxID=578454 RepID=A0AAJ8W3M4_CANPC
ELWRCIGNVIGFNTRRISTNYLIQEWLNRNSTYIINI